MKYTVIVAVDGRFGVTVNANSFQEAKDKACHETQEADFGKLECINWWPVNAEDENGVFKEY